MKNSRLAVFALVLAAPSSVVTAEHLVPAGYLIQCTISEPKLSSKTAAQGEPVLCQLGYPERYGRIAMTYNSFLVGRFEDYKDPGHFVGKGWLELTFDRMVIEPNTVVPVHAKVVDVPGYSVDKNGRILGKGHAVRDTVEWSIPLLWPIDALNLPRRGPRPVLRSETRLTLKVMDDFGVPTPEPPDRDPSGLIRRQPSAYIPRTDDPAPSAPQAAPAKASPVPDASGNTTSRVPQHVLVLRNGTSYIASGLLVEGYQLSYTLNNGGSARVSLDDVDWTKTFQDNAENGVAITMSPQNGPH